MSVRTVLWATDAGWMEPTGLGRYVNELVPRLLATGDGYVVGGSPLPSSFRGGPDSQGGAERFPVIRPPVPRRVLHAAWNTVGRPRADRWTGRPDLLHVLYPATPVPAGGRLVVTIHDLFPYSNPEWFTAKGRTMFRRAVEWAIDRAELIITVSEFVAEAVTERFGVERSRLRPIPSGVSDAFFSGVDRSDVERVCSAQGVEPGHYLIAVGELSARKNLTTVVEALADVRRDHPGLALVVAGPDGPAGVEVRALAERLGVVGAVRLAGWQEGADLRALMAGAVALVHPARAEGFGFTPIEAMAAGLPTLVSRGGAAPETTNGASFLLDPESAPDWAAAVRRVLDDGALRADLIERGRRVAAGYRWDTVAERTIAVHREALGP